MHRRRIEISSMNNIRYLLDTDITSYILRKHTPGIFTRFTAAPKDSLAISVITYAELHYGINKNPSGKIRESSVEWFTERVAVLGWGREAGSIYGQLRSHLEKSGQPIGNMDLMIAAHALALGVTLVTNNQKHFNRIDGLKVENWV